MSRIPARKNTRHLSTAPSSTRSMRLSGSRHQTRRYRLARQWHSILSILLTRLEDGGSAHAVFIALEASYLRTRRASISNLMSVKAPHHQNATAAYLVRPDSHASGGNAYRSSAAALATAPA